MDSKEDSPDVLQRIRAHIDQISPVLPNQVLIAVGQYALGAFDSERFLEDDMSTLIRILHRKETNLKTVDMSFDPEQTIILDTIYEPHYWFDLHSHLEKNRGLSDELKRRIFNYHDEVISIVSLSEGIASGILPTLHSYLMREGKSAVSIAVFPSMTHSSDALFNAFSSIGLISIERSALLILLDQSRLEEFAGVKRNGDILTGKDIIDYLIELFLDRKGFIRDLVKLSRSFNVDLYTVLMAAGCSLDIYESFRNILNITLEQPMLDFDLSTASMIYVLVRAPLHLRGQLTKGRIELEVTSWLKERADLDAPQICEPVYVDEFGDRIDVIILVGGFDTEELFSSIDKRISRFSRIMVEQELYDKEVWSSIKRQLLEN